MQLHADLQRVEQSQARTSLSMLRSACTSCCMGTCCPVASKMYCSRPLVLQGLRVACTASIYLKYKSQMSQIFSLPLSLHGDHERHGYRIG